MSRSLLATQPKVDDNKSLNVDFAVISKFGNVGVSPPVVASQLDATIEELTKKMKQFEEEGS